MAAKTAQFNYDEHIEELQGLAETLGSKKNRDAIIRHLCPQPEMKFVRSVYSDTLSDLSTELAELVTRMQEAKAAFGGASESDTPKRSSRKAPAKPAAEPTEASSTEVAVGEPNSGRQAVPA